MSCQRVAFDGGTRRFRLIDCGIRKNFAEVTRERIYHPATGFYVKGSNGEPLWSAEPGTWIIDHPRLFSRIAGDYGKLRLIGDGTVTVPVGTPSRLLPGPAVAAGIGVQYNVTDRWLVHARRGVTTALNPRFEGELRERKRHWNTSLGTEYAVNQETNVFVYLGDGTARSF